MNFDELPYRKIPILENWRRVKIITRYRDLLRQFHRRLNAGESVQSETMQELQRSINYVSADASSFIRLADLSSTVSDSQREYLSSRSKFAGIDAKLDLLDGFLWQATPGLRQAAIDLADQAIGRYNGNKSRAWVNTCNPAPLIDWLIDLSFNLVALFGRDPQEARSRHKERVAKSRHKGRVERILVLGAALATILGFVLHLLHLY